MDVDAFILIGGRSSRFGSDKALAEFEGETLAARAAKTVELALSPKHLTFVAASDTQFHGRIPFPLDFAVVADLKPGFGAWSGLHTALAYARTEWAFVLACDLPFVTAELLKLLAENRDDGYAAVVPIQPDERPQPLCALYQVRQVLPSIDEMLDPKHPLPPLISFLNGVNTNFIGADAYSELTGADKFFININAPKDLAAAKRSAPRVK